MVKTFKVPILPIPDVVFYPNTVLPIYIMEPSYVKMIQEAIENEQMIAVSLAEPVESGGFRSHKTKYSPREVCTIGTPIIVEPFSKGALKILVKGVKRVKLMDVHQNLPYLVFNAEEFPDDPKSVLLDGGIVERLKGILDSWLMENISNSQERESFYENLQTLSHIIDYLCMFLIQDVQLKQMILETPSLGERVKLLNLLLKEDNPFEEDLLTVSAFLSYEDLEKNAKASH